MQIFTLYGKNSNPSGINGALQDHSLYTRERKNHINRSTNGEDIE